MPIAREARAKFFAATPTQQYSLTAQSARMSAIAKDGAERIYIQKPPKPECISTLNDPLSML